MSRIVTYWRCVTAATIAAVAGLVLGVGPLAQAGGFAAVAFILAGLVARP